MNNFINYKLFWRFFQKKSISFHLYIDFLPHLWFWKTYEMTKSQDFLIKRTVVLFYGIKNNVFLWKKKKLLCKKLCFTT